MLTREEVKHIAHLARIGLEEEEIEKYQKDLSSVLDFFEAVKAVDTDAVEGIGHITGRIAKARSDAETGASLEERERILKNIPEKKGGSVMVRSILNV